jgi:type IV secretory pathway VirB10-like protein
MNTPFSSTERKRRYISFLLVGLVIGGVILFGSFAFFGSPKSASTVNLTAAKSEAVRGQAGGQGSEEYNSKLRQHDDTKANAALVAGESHIPTPVGKSLVAKKQPDPTPPASSPSPAATPPAQATRTQLRQDNDVLRKRILEDLSSFDAKLHSVSADPGKIVYLYDFSKEKKEDSKKEEQKSVQNPAGEAGDAIDLKPGDLLYAIVDTAVNSDVPSTVMATVATGKYSKTRFLGKFQRHEERLILAFNRAVLPDGQSVQVEAYAVDPSTTEASVAS